LALRLCRNCRFNPKNGDTAGGDCADCHEFSQWLELKRINIEKCRLCLYEDDPCHYICVGCQDSKNWTPKKNLKKRILQQIQEKEKELINLRKILSYIEKKGH